MPSVPKAKQPAALRRASRRSTAPSGAGGEYVSFTAELWRWSGANGSWHFVTLPETAAAWIKFINGKGRRGWGSVRVKATIGVTVWATSVFPDAKSGSFLLPVKSTVRAAERLEAGSAVKVRLHLEAPEPLPGPPRMGSRR